MNRRKFLKLFGRLLAALPFVQLEIPKQPKLSPWSNTEVITTISLDDYAKLLGIKSYFLGHVRIDKSHENIPVYFNSDSTVANIKEYQ